MMMTITEAMAQLKTFIRSFIFSFLLGFCTGVAIGFLTYMVMHLWEQNIQLKESAKTHEKASYKYSYLLASCMNGGTLYDKESNTAFFTSKAIAIKMTSIFDK